MDSTIGCTLPYRVRPPISLVLDVEVAHYPGQIVMSETLTLAPDVPVERWTMPKSGNRDLRVDVMPGPFMLDDRARVAFSTPFGGIEYDKPEVWIEHRAATASGLTTQAVRAEP